MLRLFGFGPAFGLADPSPFVLKVDAGLRIAGIDFESSGDFADFKKAPKGKMPYIDDNGTVVSDSSFIFDYLHEKYNDPLDRHLNDEQRAIAYLVSKSLDENFYWCLIHERWIDNDTWPTLKQSLFKSVPAPLRLVLPALVRHNMKSAFIKQGMGRHSSAEVRTIGEKTLANLSTLLGDKEWFLTDTPCSLDATAFGFLAHFTLSSLPTDLGNRAKQYPNLVEFCERIQNTYYA